MNPNPSTFQTNNQSQMKIDFILNKDECNQTELIPFHVSQHEDGPMYYPVEKEPALLSEKNSDWFDNNMTWEYPWRITNQFNLPMSQVENYTFRKVLIYFTLSQIERLVFYRMQVEYTKFIPFSRLVVGMLDIETWNILVRRLRFSKQPALLSKNPKSFQDYITFRKSRTINHGYEKLVTNSQKITWTNEKGFPTLISASWNRKKYVEPAYPGTLYRCELLSFSLLYREYNGELRCSFSYKSERYCDESK